jgi:hypothetical protein
MACSCADDIVVNHAIVRDFFKSQPIPRPAQFHAPITCFSLIVKFRIPIMRKIQDSDQIYILKFLLLFSSPSAYWWMRTVNLSTTFYVLELPLVQQLWPNLDF